MRVAWKHCICIRMLGACHKTVFWTWFRRNNIFKHQPNIQGQRISRQKPLHWGRYPSKSRILGLHYANCISGRKFNPIIRLYHWKIKILVVFNARLISCLTDKCRCRDSYRYCVLVRHCSVHGKCTPRFESGRQNYTSFESIISGL